MTAEFVQFIFSSGHHYDLQVHKCFPGWILWENLWPVPPFSHCVFVLNLAFSNWEFSLHLQEFVFLIHLKPLLLSFQSGSFLITVLNRIHPFSNAPDLEWHWKCHNFFLIRKHVWMLVLCGACNHPPVYRERTRIQHKCVPVHFCIAN